MKKKIFSRVTSRAMTFLFVVGIIVFAIPNNLAAETATGRVTFVGTMSEVYLWGGYSSVFRLRLSDSECGGSTASYRWIHVISGRMDGEYVHNLANFRNAYNTVMSAFLSGKGIQVDGVPNCDISQAQEVYLWNATIGIY